jgi:ribonuclease G
VESKETVVTRLHSWVRRFRAQTGEMGLTIKAHPVIVDYITQGLRSHLRRIMWDALLYIRLEPDDSLKIDEFKGYSWKQKREVTSEYESKAQ